MKDIKKENALQYTRRVLGRSGKAKKALGQNFLIDDQIIERIIDEGIPDRELPLVEIGPGPGGLTRILMTKKKRLWAVELDSEKIEILTREFKEEPVTFLHLDALQLQLKDIWGSEKGWLVGNLPYYITNPLLMHFLDQKDSLFGMTVMVQREVADRMTAKPGGKDYGILSIAVQLSAECRKMFDVPPSAFMPQPKVTSTVLQLSIQKYPDFDTDLNAFFKVVKSAFAQRRKTLLNSLSAGLGISKVDIGEILMSLGIDEMRRAESIGIPEYQEITRELLKQNRFVIK